MEYDSRLVIACMETTFPNNYRALFEPETIANREIKYALFLTPSANLTTTGQLQPLGCAKYSLIKRSAKPTLSAMQ